MINIKYFLLISCDPFSLILLNFLIRFNFVLKVFHIFPLFIIIMTKASLFIRSSIILECLVIQRILRICFIVLVIEFFLFDHYSMSSLIFYWILIV